MWVLEMLLLFPGRTFLSHLRCEGRLSWKSQWGLRILAISYDITEADAPASGSASKVKGIRIYLFHLAVLSRVFKMLASIQYWTPLTLLVLKLALSVGAGDELLETELHMSFLPSPASSCKILLGYNFLSVLFACFVAAAMRP